MADKIKLWFFRDLNDDQRLKLFSLFDLPTKEIGNHHGRQNVALQHIMKSLIKMVVEAAAPTPSSHVEGEFFAESAKKGDTDAVQVCPECDIAGCKHLREPHATVASKHAIIKDSHFGPYIAIGMPTGCNMIVVFADKHQHVPVWLGLPHQLYVSKALALMTEHKCETLTIAPYRNEDKVEISRAALATTEGSDNG